MSQITVISLQPYVTVHNNTSVANYPLSDLCTLSTLLSNWIFIEQLDKVHTRAPGMNMCIQAPQVTQYLALQYSGKSL